MNMRNATCVGTETSKVPTRVTLLFIFYSVVWWMKRIEVMIGYLSISYYLSLLLTVLIPRSFHVYLIWTKSIAVLKVPKCCMLTFSKLNLSRSTITVPNTDTVFFFWKCKPNENHPKGKTRTHSEGHGNPHSKNR